MPSIIVNSLGETFQRNENDGQNDRTLGAGSVNISAVAKQVLTAKQHAVWSTFKGQQAEALDRYVSAKCQEEFLQEAWEDMPLPVFDFYKRVTDLQILNDSRFRVWGRKEGLSFNAKESIWLVTEFIGFVDEKQFWAKLKSAAKRPYSLYIMRESEHTDKTYKPGVNGVLPDYSNANDSNAIYGENHGRMERQVEFRKNIASISKQRDAFTLLREEINKLREITDPFWNLSGVSIL